MIMVRKKQKYVRPETVSLPICMDAGLCTSRTVTTDVYVEDSEEVF